MRAVTVSTFGGPDVLTSARLADPTAGPGELVVDVAAAGVNYMDVHQRQGSGPFRPDLPFVPGNEGAGTVRSVGPGVTGFRRGDRVAWSGVLGSYAEAAVVPAARVVAVPPGLDLATAAGLLLQGMTAHYLSSSAVTVRPGDVVVVHAAAGGVGLLLTQMLRRRGARVIATASTPAKAALVRSVGANATATYEELGTVVELETAGRGADVVYDSVGRATFEDSLAALAPRGTLVLLGASSGPVPPFDLQRLASTSAFVTRPTLAHYVGNREQLVMRGSAVLDAAARGTLHFHLGGRYALGNAARAHEDLEGRRTSGKLLLVP